MARNDRTIRLELVKNALASSRTGVLVRTLAERHNWPLTNLYRDIKVLEESNLQVVWDGPRVRIENVPPRAGVSGRATPEERLALYLAREQARGWKGTTLGKALDRLWHRIVADGDGQTAMVPVDSVPWLTIADWRTIDHDRYRQVVATLETATRDRREVEATYRAASTGETTERILEPGQLHWDPGLETLYLIAYCQLRRDVRVFAAHRFVKATATPRSCAPRAETRSKNALAKAFRVWRSASVASIAIKFASRVATEIRERRWIAGQRVEEQRDGGVVLRGEVAGLEEMRRWVLGFGGDAHVLAPPKLVTAVAGELERAAEPYKVTAVRRPRRAVPVASRKNRAADSLSRSGKGGA